MGYLLNMNNQEKVSVTAVPFNPQTQSFTPAQPTQAIAPAAPVVPNMPTPNPTITADNLGVQKINVPGTQTATVKSYRDNPDGTTTNTLSDGTTSTVRYTKNPDGSLTPVEVDTPVKTVNQAEQLLAQTAVAETEAQKASQDLSKSILSLIPNLQGQTQELATQQRAAGLPAMKQNLQNINNQILQKQAELQQDDIRLVQSVQNIEDKPIAMEFITGQQQSVQRNAQIARALKASEIGVLNATALGMQGNISLAEQTAKQAVETKYAPYKEALDTYKLQLEALTPLLNADEKKQAREQEIKTKLAFNDIEKRQKTETANNSMLVKAIAQGAPASITSKAQELAKKGASEAEVAGALGVYAGDYLDTQIKRAQLAKLGLDIRKSNQELAGDGAGLRSLSTEEFTRFNATPQAKGVRDATNYARAVKNYREAINKYGTGEVFGQGSGALNEAYSSLVGATKDYYTLGTYDNGVEKLIGIGIPAPSIYGLKEGRVSALDSALKTAKEKITADGQQLIKSRYGNSEELASLLEGSSEIFMEEQSMDEFLSNLPGGSNGVGNADFFGASVNSSTKQN